MELCSPPALTDQWTTFWATHRYQHRSVEGVEWSYIAGGEGDEALLLLPGAPGRGETSFQYILALEGLYRVLAPSYPAAIRSADTLVDGLAGLLQAEGIARAHVLGGSYSGTIAQHLLRRRPALVDRLVLSDTGGPDRRRARQARWLLRCVESLPFGVVRALLKLGTYAFTRTMGAERRFWRQYFHRLLDGLNRADVISRLAVAIDIDSHEAWEPWHPRQASGTILILDAAGDALFGSTARADLLALYPGAVSQTLSGGGHAASLADARAYIAAIAAFVGSADRAMA